MTREDENDLYYGKSYLTNIANLNIASNFFSKLHALYYFDFL